MPSRVDRYLNLLVLVALSAALAAYLLARPGGLADVAATSHESKSSETAKSVPAPVFETARADNAGNDFEDSGATELDAPIYGAGDANVGEGAHEDIPDNMTINANGEMVRPGPPVLRDQSISSDDGVPGAD